MPGGNSGASMASLATPTTTSSSSAMGVELFAGILARTSSKHLSFTSPPSLTPLNTAEAFISSPPSKCSPISAEAKTSDSATTSLPDLTTFPDLNLKILTLLARLKNPSSRSTEELQSALAEADAILSDWKAELLNINEDQSRERELKPAAHIEIRPRNPITVRKEKDSVWKDCNQQKRLGAGIGGVGLRAVERLKPFLVAEGVPSIAPSRSSEPIPAVALEGASVTVDMPHQADSLTPTSGRGQRAHKPRKFFGETSPASRDRRRGPHEGGKDQTGKRMRPVGQPPPMQGATRTEPKDCVAEKRKRDDRNGEEEDDEDAPAAEPSKKIRTRFRSATHTPSQQQPSKKLILVLKTRGAAPNSRPNPVTFNTERTPRTTHSTSRTATPAIAKKAVCESASITPTADTNRALSKVPTPTSAPVPPEKEVKRFSHSDVMLAVWERRWAEGRSGLYGGKPLPSSVKLREEKLAKTRELRERGRSNGRRSSNQALSKVPTPTSAPVPPKKEVKRSSHSDVMLEVWERRWAEGRGGLYGGKPLPSSVKLREENLAKTRELSERGRLNGRRSKRRKG